MTKKEVAREEDKLGSYRQAIKDARYIFEQYKDRYPAEAWETLKRILFNPNLR